MRTERLSVKCDDKGKWIWHLAPAYDLTRSTEGYNGEHATSVNSTSHPAYDDFLAVGIKAKIPPARCRELYEQVRDNLIIHTSAHR